MEWEVFEVDHTAAMTQADTIDVDTEDSSRTATLQLEDGSQESRM